MKDYSTIQEERDCIDAYVVSVYNKGYEQGKQSVKTNEASWEQICENLKYNSYWKGYEQGIEDYRQALLDSDYSENRTWLMTVRDIDPKKLVGEWRKWKSETAKDE